MKLKMFKISCLQASFMIFAIGLLSSWDGHYYWIHTPIIMIACFNFTWWIYELVKFVNEEIRRP